MGRALAIFDAAGIGRAVDLSGGPTAEALAEAIEAASRSQGRVVVFANLDWRGALEPGWLERQLAWLGQAKAMGARGLKIFKSLGLTIRDPAGARLAVDDPRLDPIFEAAGRLGLPVAIHTGDPKAFFEPLGPGNERREELALNPAWSFADRARFPAWDDLFAELVRRVERHPKTKFLAVHFGDDPEDPAHVGELMDRLPNLYVDTAARVGEIGRRPTALLRRIFLSHPRRILFGSDIGVSRSRLTLGAPEPEPASDADAPPFYAAQFRFFETSQRGLPNPIPVQGHWTVDGLGLPREALEELYHRNAERLLGLAPL